MTAIIDLPDDKRPVDRHGFMVSGWIWLGENQANIAAIEAWSGDILLGSSDTLLRRADVNSAHTLAAEVRTGFSLVARHSELKRGRDFGLQLRALLRDGRRTEILCHQIMQSFGSAMPVAVPIEPERSAPEPIDLFEVPPHFQVRQAAGNPGPKFYASGRVILRQLAHVFREADRPLETAQAILDLGCGCGRVLRNFKFFPHIGKIWGCDIDAEAIAWNRANLNDLARFEINPPMPPTAFHNAQFDAIYAVSVFTHLPEEMQFAWLTEIRRILRPGGVLIASLHGARYWNNGEETVTAEVAARGFAYRSGPRIEGLPEFYMVAYHSEAYVRERWTRFFELVDLKEKYLHGVQDAAILRRRHD